MSDAAAFNKGHLNLIWGDYPPCLLCPEDLRTNAFEFHHIYGRGGRHKRKLHSSVFNAAPLCRTCHSRGDIKSLSRKLMDTVSDQIAKSEYRMNDNDTMFLLKYA